MVKGGGDYDTAPRHRSARSDSYGTVSAKVGYRAAQHVSFSLALDNLTDQRYVVFNWQPGAPRSANSPTVPD